jgi:hypothetical protein
MFDRTTSIDFLAPRRQERKGKIFPVFRTWRPLRLWTTHLFSDSCSSPSSPQRHRVLTGFQSFQRFQPFKPLKISGIDLNDLNLRLYSRRFVLRASAVQSPNLLRAAIKRNHHEAREEHEGRKGGFWRFDASPSSSDLRVLRDLRGEPSEFSCHPRRTDFAEIGVFLD